VTDATAATVSEVARGIGHRLEELTAEMTSMFVDVIPEFRHDEAVQRLMVASTASNLSTMVDVLTLGISPEDITVPPAAAEYARRFAQHDLSLEALLRAYRLGEHMFLQWAVHELRPRELSMAQALEVTARVALLVNSYIDQVIEGLIDIYRSEREQWEKRSDAARAAQVRAVLDTPSLEISSAEEMLGVGLRGWHIAAVAWADPSEADGSLRAVGRLLADASGRFPMTVWPDGQTVWAWLSFPAPRRLDTDGLVQHLREHPELKIAVGEPGAGLAGFRASHQEAVRTRQVAEVAIRPGSRLYEHTHLALAGLLIDRRDELQVWVRRILGDLAQADESMTRLRETLQIFLEANGSFTDAATRMHVHKNTVHYRVRKAEEVIGRPVTDGRLSIEVALLACDQLAVTTRPAPPARAGRKSSSGRAR
jgi:DNA-binding PucR family transcriptional regulator